MEDVTQFCGHCQKLTKMEPICSEPQKDAPDEIIVECQTCHHRYYMKGEAPCGT